MPVKGRRSIAICRRCNGAIAVRIVSDGSIRPIGTGTHCSCGGDSFDVIGSPESVPTDSTE
ncbi:hypothetical protein SAMN04487967_1822 [Natronorubrum sediminis]|uniref:Uncharacterized protein n=1 Tax=Natronorubrum sediminis TaxID=640943 RepID=A0A1H6FXJ6_9EURY|nr:hypothetical protein SAMN04487967_1822 [Natronorubrum sediminis]